MVTWWWSWLLTAAGACGLWLAGSHRRAGWAIGLAAQALWIGYALSTRQYGFLASALIYGSVYARNMRHWRAPVAPPGPRLRDAATCPHVPNCFTRVDEEGPCDGWNEAVGAGGGS